MGVHTGADEGIPDGRNILTATTTEWRTAVRVPSEQPTRGLVITYEQGADEWLASNQPTTDGLPADLTIISVGDTVRSTAARSKSGVQIPETPPSSPTVVTIPERTNLSSLGITITKYLKESRENDGTAETVLLVDSLNGLLEGVPLRRAFRFLHVLTALVRRSGVTAYYRLDESVLESQVVGTIRVLFDEEQGLSGR